MTEQLTDCGTRVMRYLPTHLTMHEIAREMFVSVNTVSTHTRHLYAKSASTAATRPWTAPAP